MIMHTIAQSWFLKNSTTYTHDGTYSDELCVLQGNMHCHDNILCLPQLLCDLLIGPLWSDFWSPTHKCSGLEKSNRKDIISMYRWLAIQCNTTSRCVLTWLYRATTWSWTLHYAQCILKAFKICIPISFDLLLKSSKSINTYPIDVFPGRIPAVSWLAVFIIGCPIQVCNLYENSNDKCDSYNCMLYYK